MYFIFAGFHLAFSTYMAVGIPCKSKFQPFFPILALGRILSPAFACTGWFKARTDAIATGSAGLINTIAMFSQGHILAGVFGILSSIGWILQAAGGGLLYKKVWDFKNNNADITFAEVSTGITS